MIADESIIMAWRVGLLALTVAQVSLAEQNQLVGPSVTNEPLADSSSAGVLSFFQAGNNVTSSVLPAPCAPKEPTFVVTLTVEVHGRVLDADVAAVLPECLGLSQCQISQLDVVSLGNCARVSSCKRAVVEVAVQNLATALDRKHQLQQASMAGLASCFAANGHRTWKVDCMDVPTVQPVQRATLPGTNPTLWTGEWGECSANCGGGWQERTLLCEAAPGLLTELWRCPEAANAPAFRSCSNDACTVAQWAYGTWSDCTSICGGGTSSRSANCSLVETANKNSSCTGPLPLGNQKGCNTYACELYVWSTSPWSDCNATCGGGSMTREVTCMHARRGVSVNASLCIGSPPSKTAQCNVIACEPCLGLEGKACSGQGHCRGGTCNCEDDFTGLACEVPSACSSGIVDSKGQCCPSGVADAKGNCCDAGSVLDKGSSCCSEEELDACGICGGKGRLVDVQGTCCETVVDAQGVCCSDQNIDECGVCGGLGSTCALILEIHITMSTNATAATKADPGNQVVAAAADALQLPPQSIEVSLMPLSSEPENNASSYLALLLITPPGSSAGNSSTSLDHRSDLFSAAGSIASLSGQASGGQRSVPYSAANARRIVASALLENNSSAFAAAQLQYAGRTGMCGNSFCEIGERGWATVSDGMCPSDCPITHHSCRKHNGNTCNNAGRCFANTGECDCFSGYVGDACQLCADGFVRSRGLCIFQSIRGHSGQANAGPGTAPALPPAHRYMGIGNHYATAQPSSASPAMHVSPDSAREDAQGSVAAPDFHHYPKESPAIIGSAAVVPSYAPQLEGPHRRRDSLPNPTTNLLQHGSRLEQAYSGQGLAPTPVDFPSLNEATLPHVQGHHMDSYLAPVPTYTTQPPVLDYARSQVAREPSPAPLPHPSEALVHFVRRGATSATGQPSQAPLSWFGKDAYDVMPAAPVYPGSNGNPLVGAPKSAIEGVQDSATTDESGAIPLGQAPIVSHSFPGVTTSEWHADALGASRGTSNHPAKQIPGLSAVLSPGANDDLYVGEGTAAPGHDTPPPTVAKEDGPFPDSPLSAIDSLLGGPGPVADSMLRLVGSGLTMLGSHPLPQPPVAALTPENVAKQNPQPSPRVGASTPQVLGKQNIRVPVDTLPTSGSLVKQDSQPSWETLVKQESQPSWETLVGQPSQEWWAASAPEMLVEQRPANALSADTMHSSPVPLLSKGVERTLANPSIFNWSNLPQGGTQGPADADSVGTHLSGTSSVPMTAQQDILARSNSAGSSMTLRTSLVAALSFVGAGLLVALVSAMWYYTARSRQKYTSAAAEEELLGVREVSCGRLSTSNPQRRASQRSSPTGLRDQYDKEARERARIAWACIQEQLRYGQGTLPAADLRRMELNIQNRIYDS